MPHHLLCVHALRLLIVLIFTVCGVNSALVKCKQDTDCQSPLKCHKISKFCLNLQPQVSPGSSRKQSQCNCLSNEYCHPIFVRCLPYLTAPAPRNNRKSTARKCINDTDCKKGRYCHQHFKICLDILAIPTLSTTKTSAVSCKNDSYCAKQKYCHDIFKICLFRHNNVSFNATASQSKFVCSNNTDCQAGYYCHNMTNICFKMHAVKQLNKTRMPSPLKKNSSCRNNSDCRITEICYHIFGQAKVVVKHKRRCKDKMRCLQMQSHRATGACIPRMVKFDPTFFNCSNDKECGLGKCCLKKLGVCRSIPKTGQPCVTKVADFICACSGKMYCKPNARGKKLRGKRLENKLKIPKYIRHLIINKGLSYHKKYTYGRCQHVAG